jgi:pyruvate/2-oxoglutarate dehydrogenase complex dihydrolipoamide acyltransferase (E2) component
MPDVGSGPLTVSVWLARPGERVYAGDRLVEILMSGATFDVSSPATGRLVEKLASPDEVVTPGQILGFVEEE